MAVYDEYLNNVDVENSTFAVLCKMTTNTKEKMQHKTMQSMIDEA